MQTPQSVEPDRLLDLPDYLALMRLHKWTILGILFVTVAAAYYWSSSQVPVYSSTAQVLVPSTQTLPGQAAAQFVNMQTEAQVAASMEVAEVATERLKFRGSPRELDNGLSVTSTPESQILDFSYTSLKPEEAQERAQAFAEAYLRFRELDLLDRVLSAQEPIRQAITDKKAELRRAQDRLEQTFDPTTQGRIERQIDGLDSDIDFLEQQLLTLTPPSSFDVGSIIQPAQFPSEPVSSGMLRNLTAALVAGLALGIGIVFLRERLDDSLRGRDDLELYLGAPVLAVIPKIRGWKARNEPYLATLSDPDSEAAEAFRTLRIGLLFAASRTEASTILVTSASAGEGKSTVAANLGAAFSAAGKSVVVVSGDLRRPRLNDFYKTPISPGLTNALAGEFPVDRLLQRVSWSPNLRVLASGPVPGNPAELLSSSALGRLLEELKATADFVLIDVPPVLAVSDAFALSPFVDGILFVADSGRTKRSAVTQSRRLLHQVNAVILGAVLSNDDPAKRRSNAQYHSYDISYGLGDDHVEVPRRQRGTLP